jgi:hypothetical protein
MKKLLSDAQANLLKLPAWCFGRLLSDNTIIRINAGETGYRPCNQDWPQKECKARNITLDQLIDELNAKDGVTKAQRHAMECGSMWGWEKISADPDIYDENGVIIKEKLNSKIA